MYTYPNSLFLGFWVLLIVAMYCRSFSSALTPNSSFSSLIAPSITFSPACICPAPDMSQQLGCDFLLALLFCNNICILFSYEKIRIESTIAEEE